MAARSPTALLNWLRLETGQPTPLYRQIAEQLRQAVLGGMLTPGTSLPSSRALARDLGVSRITVLEAYDLLASEGFVEARRGAGTRIAVDLSPSRLIRLAEAEDLERQAADADITNLLQLYGPEPSALAFQPGIPAFDAFPHALWSRQMARAALLPGADRLDYAHIGGQAELRFQIARYLNGSRGVRCLPEQVIVVTSVRAAIAAVAGVLWHPGATVAVEDPGYGVARRVLTGLGHPLLPVRTDGAGLRADDLTGHHGDCAGAYLTPAHHWPTGAALTASRRIKLLDWAIERGAWIIEDDYDSEFRFDSAPLPTLQSLGSGRVIYVGTFSKTLAPSLRTAYLVVPPDRIRDFHRHVFEQAVEPALHIQIALAGIMADGHFVRHVARMRKLYQSRRALLIEALRARMGQRLCLDIPPGGLQITARAANGASAAEIERRCTEAGLVVRDLARYCVRAPATNAVHLGFAAIPDDQIDPAVARLRQALADCL